MLFRSRMTSPAMTPSLARAAVTTVTSVVDATESVVSPSKTKDPPLKERVAVIAPHALPGRPSNAALTALAADCLYAYVPSPNVLENSEATIADEYPPVNELRVSAATDRMSWPTRMWSPTASSPSGRSGVKYTTLWQLKNRPLSRRNWLYWPLCSAYHQLHWGPPLERSR